MVLPFGGFLEWLNCDIIIPVRQMSKLRLVEINSLPEVAKPMAQAEVELRQAALGLHV